MNIEELKARKDKLERDLEESISSLLKDFSDEAGLTPSCVDVQMIECTSLGQIRPRHWVSRVRCDIAI